MKDLKPLIPFDVPIKCWYCNTCYKYNEYEVCPNCKHHFVDSGKRISVKIDCTKNIIKTLIIVFLLSLFSCGSMKSCPTYSKEERPLTKWDTVPATYADVIEYMANDTIPYKPSLAEKIGAGVAIIFIINLIKQQ